MVTKVTKIFEKFLKKLHFVKITIETLHLRYFIYIYFIFETFCHRR